MLFCEMIVLILIVFSNVDCPVIFYVKQFTCYCGYKDYCILIKLLGYNGEAKRKFCY